jgi:FtsP/CotA-like multicopper oxidase with cupredoxin domain
LGLYGTLIVRPAAGGQAYNAGSVDSSYDNESVLLFSEIDPAFNAYVDANGTIVDTVNKINYSIRFAPKYFLINGKAFPETADISAPAGQRTLLRLINSGPRTYVPTIQDAELTVIAEDGYLLNFARHEFAPSLTAGKTLDVITAPTGTGYRAIHDRRLGIANAGVFPGGMLTFAGDLNCSPLKGDVTGDGTVTAADALTVLRAFVNGTTAGLPANTYGPLADVSLDRASELPCGDGIIDLDDILKLLQKTVGLDTY